MQCPDKGSRLSSYHDGELDPARAEQVRRHVAGCPSCAAVLAGMNAADQRLREWAPLPLPADLRARVWQRARAGERAGGFWRGIARWAMPVAVGCSSLIIALSLLVSLSPVVTAAGNVPARRSAAAAVRGTFAGWGGSSLSGFVNFSCFCEQCRSAACSHCAAGGPCSCGH